jgi:hypothetical protein
MIPINEPPIDEQRPAQVVDGQAAGIQVLLLDRRRRRRARTRVAP